MKNNGKKSRYKVLSFKFFCFDFVKYTGALPVLIGLRPKFYYASKAAKKHVKGAAIAVSNHVSYLDPVRMYTAFWYRRVHLVATEALFSSKSNARFFKSMLCIPINPEAPSFKFFGEVKKRLDRGALVGIFPEGHVNRASGDVQPFKAGVLLLAMRSNVPIIPAYIKPAKHAYNRTKIAFGEPVTIEQLCGTEKPDSKLLEAGAQALRERVVALKDIIK